MSISSEIENLNMLREKGILNDKEFQIAKDKLLNTMGSEHNTGTGVNKIGNAAVSWVNLQWVSYAIGLVAVALMIVFVVTTPVATVAFPLPSTVRATTRTL